MWSRQSKTREKRQVFVPHRRSTREGSIENSKGLFLLVCKEPNSPKELGRYVTWEEKTSRERCLISFPSSPPLTRAEVVLERGRHRELTEQPTYHTLDQALLKKRTWAVCEWEEMRPRERCPPSVSLLPKKKQAGVSGTRR